MNMNPVTPRIVLYEGAGSEAFSSAARYEIMRALLEKGFRVTRVCAGGQVGAHDDSPLLVLGQFSSGAAAAVSEGVQASIDVRNVSGLGPEEIVALIDPFCGPVEQAAGQADAPAPKHWKPWFPVIDYDRCTNCMQCLSFCLFDVYGVSTEKKIQVQNQANCKTDCPACSRVCPEVAILFPKYKAGPINGAEVNSEDLRREAMKVDISSLLGGDIYALLRDRSAKAQSRFSVERDEERALKERQRCLTKLQEALDIPDEALASLPSMAQIQAKAEKALALSREAVES